MNKWGFQNCVFIIGASLLGTSVVAVSNPLSTLLTKDEEKILEARLRDFYETNDLNVMNQRLPKTNPRDGFPVRRSKLRKKAGRASRPGWFEKKYKKNGALKSWSSAKVGDKVTDLTETYLSPKQITYRLDEISTHGETSLDYWSGDYWRMNWGGTSYRYSSGKKFKLYKKAVEFYRQPQEWINLWDALSLASILDVVEMWSPSEKYDLLMGDEKFTLTREQKAEGADFVDKTGQVESWFGICDGWSPASVFVPVPKKSVTTMGSNGITLKWYPDDIRALASLAWTNGDFETNFIGRRCEDSNPRVYANGRIVDEDCADTNPATFHLALGLLLGESQVPFIMDASLDAEVWNQPVLSYEFKYFNPLKLSEQSQNWRDVMVPYDESFKKRDRFQKPLTRGYKKDGHYFDGGIKAVVGVETTVVYLTEYEAKFYEKAQENVTERVTYTYDLELHQKDGELIAMGGEWHSNLHPDFLWVPKRNEVSTAKWDDKNLKVDLLSLPKENLSELASKASKEGYPLCSAIEALVNASSDGNRTYRCSK